MTLIYSLMPGCSSQQAASRAVAQLTYRKDYIANICSWQSEPKYCWCLVQKKDRSSQQWVSNSSCHWLMRSFILQILIEWMQCARSWGYLSAPDRWSLCFLEWPLPLAQGKIASLAMGPYYWESHKCYANPTALLNSLSFATPDHRDRKARSCLPSFPCYHGSHMRPSCHCYLRCCLPGLLGRIHVAGPVSSPSFFPEFEKSS